MFRHTANLGIRNILEIVMNKLITLQKLSLASIVATGLVVVGAVSPVAAEPSPSMSRTHQVSFNDLDLSTAEGMGIARDRVHQMARSLCSQVADSLDLSRQPNYVKCIDAAMASALPRLEVLARSKGATSKVAANKVPQ
jgi:UrcA family protein